MTSVPDPWEMLNQRLDQMQSLVNSFGNRNSMCGNTPLDEECQGQSTMYLGNQGYLDPQTQYQNDPNFFQPHPSQPFLPEPLNIYPHSPHPESIPQPYEKPYLRDTPLAYPGSNAAFPPPSTSLEEMIREQDDILRSLTDNMSKISGLSLQTQESSKESRNQAGANHSKQEVERRTYTTSITPDTDFRSDEFNIPSTPTPTQPSKPSLSPIPDLSTSKIDGGFVLEELSEPMQLKTSGRSDEDDEVDDEIEMECPNWRIYTEDTASQGLEGYIQTPSSELIPVQTGVVTRIPQQVVVNCIPQTPLNDSLPDLIDFNTILEEPDAQFIDDSFVTRMETLMDIIPPPCLEYNIITNPKVLGSKVGFASRAPYKPSLHYVMTYTSWSDEDLFDQPITLKEEKVEGFVLLQIKQFTNFVTPSPLIGHTLTVAYFSPSGMCQFFRLCLVMDAREPPRFPEK